ncbi:hypothetical protein [Paraburkholderia sp. BL21I4N1]|uniref:hypothetical protein n=1 Tax=Paraburkholderia sp. BL21I4N1 TaxID=1938801 RepID=UPI000D4957F2|nr:hypothetical protein [Paraburkholderia sp. BL21I4N1]PQV43970.1 hypothetical protein B0G83_13025 [Paraburkholderia sp. BL21I4N1]
MPLPVDVELLADVSMNALDATRQRDQMSGRSRTSAFTGSRIRMRDHELLVVEIGPFGQGPGRTVTFRAQSVGAVVAPAGAILDTRWGICEVVA